MNKLILKDLTNYCNQKLSFIYKEPGEASIYTNWIFEHILKLNLGQILINQDKIITEQEFKFIEDILDRHINKSMPLQYIFGQIPFLDLEIQVEEPILIPRPETEYWCQEILKKLEPLNKENLKILDLCTGTGCIGLSFAAYLKNSQVIAVDINQKACDLALKNAQINNIKNIKILKSDLYEGLEYGLKFDLILSNPPYISFNEWQNLDPSVKNWEDKIALTTKDNGLYIINKIIFQAKNWLKYNEKFHKLNIPQVVIEIGHEQGESVKKIFQENGFTDININKDLSSKDRFVSSGVSVGPIL